MFGQLVIYVVVAEMYKIARRSIAQQNTSKVEDMEMHVAYTMEPIDNRIIV